MRMFLSGLAVALAAGATVTALAAGSPAATSETAKSAVLTIRHQVKGCHTWSLSGNAYKAAQVAHFARGTTLTIVNNDVMPQTLIEKSGPAAKYSGNKAMSHVGASVKASFSKAGVYSFFTKAGEDYSFAKNSKTTGEDNVLTLKVVVS